MIKEKFNLTGKVAIITGASKGIGEAIARGMAEFGAKVVVSSRKQDAVDAVAEKFKKDGLEAIGIECHVADYGQCESLIQQTMDHYGRLDILVNNAGTNPYYGPIEKMIPGAYQKTMDVNLNAPMYLSNLVFPHMKRQGSGSIIHISSVEGFHASQMMAAYNMSKAGLIMLCKNQAAEWGRHGIRVNVICPGFVKTKLSAALLSNEEMNKNLLRNIPLSRAAEPEEMAGLACFLASDAASYCTGAAMVNDGGFLLSPLT